MRPGLAMVVMALGCGAPEALPDGGVEGGSRPDPEEVLAAKGLVLRDCRPGAADIGGVFAVRFETVDTLSHGDDVAPQEQRVTRYGVAELCVEQRDIVVDMLVCNMAVGPVLHAPSHSCGAEVPTAAILAPLPVVRFKGEIDLGADVVRLTGWNERWGLRDGAALPPEPTGVDQLDPAAAEAAGVLDQDGDGHVGVTLVGSAVPTRTFVARVTTAGFELRAGRNELSGTTTSTTQQVVLGGPATRIVRGRVRVPAGGNAGFLRADGIAGADDIGVGDGVVQCSEVQAWVGAPLADPVAGACDPPEDEP